MQYLIQQLFVCYMQYWKVSFILQSNFLFVWDWWVSIQRAVFGILTLQKVLCSNKHNPMIQGRFGPDDSADLRNTYFNVWDSDLCPHVVS